MHQLVILQQSQRLDNPTPAPPRTSSDKIIAIKALKPPIEPTIVVVPIAPPAPLSIVSYPPPIVPVTKSRSYANSLLASTEYVVEPTNIHIALQLLIWIESIEKKIDAFHEKATCTFTFLPYKLTRAWCKSIFKIKRKPYGIVEIHKALLVTKRLSQQAGFNYLDIFSPIAKHLR